MSEPELCICVFHHAYGVDCFAFYSVPAGALKHPSPRKVAEHFNIDFEPDKGETFEVIVANSSNPETLGAAEIGRETPASPSWWEDDEEGWRDGQADMDDEDDEVAASGDAIAGPEPAAVEPAPVEVRLPCFGITVQLNRRHSATNPGSGTITSDLKHGAPDADAQYDAAVDGLESLILAHACSGIDIKSPAYLEGIETAVEAIANHFGR